MRRRWEGCAFLTAADLLSHDFQANHKFRIRLKISDVSSHNSRILDQFTRQAAPFAAAAPIRNQEALDRIVQWAGAGPDDTVLDVACGPGLLACAFARVAKHATGIDMTPAMLEQARKTQQEQGLKNVSWLPGNVYSLPFPPAQ